MTNKIYVKFLPAYIIYVKFSVEAVFREMLHYTFCTILFQLT